jgi:hypothetical protein
MLYHCDVLYVRFSPQPLVVDAFVVEAEGGELTDLVSFYTLPSTVLGHPEHKELRAAYMFYTGGGVGGGLGVGGVMTFHCWGGRRGGITLHLSLVWTVISKLQYHFALSKNQPCHSKTAIGSVHGTA